MKHIMKILQRNKKIMSVEISDKMFLFLILFEQIRIFRHCFAYNLLWNFYMTFHCMSVLFIGCFSLLDFHNKVTTSETLISDNRVRSQVHNNVKSSLIMVYYLY